VLHDLKTISLILAFIFPFVWGLTFLFVGIKNERSKVFLSFLMLFASFTYLMTYFKFEGIIDAYAFLFPFQAATVLTLFPLFYLYVLSLTSEKRIPFLNIIVHFVLSILVFICFIVLQKVLIGADNEIDFVKYLLDKKDVVIGEYFTLGKVIYDIGKLMFVVTTLFYVLASVWTLRKHYLQVKELFSENDLNELKWLRGLGGIFIFMVGFFVVIHLLNNNQVETHVWLIISSYLMFALFFWYLGLNGFRQKEVYNIVDVEKVEEFKTEIRIGKDEIIQYLLNSKTYKRQDISVFNLCYHFHTNRTYMSESIRQNFDTNFRGLINRYRIVEAIEVIESNLINNLDFDLENIASNSGFSSYSTFLRVFKGEIGVTPSEYIKNVSRGVNKS
jgi:AraC-like DNA-binding protein